jgi:hypothetical protein
MPSFLFESLFWWGLPLVGLPVLIHLINMMRHRRVRWAAMEFLLVSQKRHRTWIILKQLLLLLLRMAAVAAVVGMVAQPLVRQRLGGVLGDTKTHHVVLLDDSFSMSDRWTDSSAFDEAKALIAKIAAKAAQQETHQALTLLRYSRATAQAEGVRYDLVQQAVDLQFPQRLDDLLRGLEPAESAAGPLGALEAVAQLPPPGGDEDRLVYLVSDYRSRDWHSPTAVRKLLERVAATKAELHLVNCVDEARSNLALTGLRPAPGTRAAGVPLPMEVSVHNFGTTPARDVSVLLAEDGQSRPAVEFGEVPAGRTVARRFQVHFATAGEHQVTARLPSDHVLADNGRFAVLDLPAAVPVLVVDGDPRGRDAYFLTSVLSPGGTINTGLAPVVESPRFLDHQPLAPYSAIYLLNVERLSSQAIESLEAYVRAGGGVAVFVGELTRADFVNRELYRDGRGLFPVPLGFATELLVDRADKTPDLEVSNHPVFAVFGGQRNGFLSAVNIQRYFTVAAGWSPAAGAPTKVIARLRNSAPLAIEHRLGEGRVLAVLTKASPTDTDRGSWNNWGADNPSFVVALLEMQAWLSARAGEEAPRLVGTPLEVSLETGKFQREVRFLMPGRGPQPEALTIAAVERSGSLVATLADVERSGLYEAQVTAADGQVSSRRFAVNVAAEEGDLQVVDLPQLTARLPGVKFQYYRAADYAYDPAQRAGLNLGQSLLFLLIAVLLGEQVLAYSASYHVARRGAA